MSKNWIYNKAELILKQRAEEQKGFMNCLEAGICPTCGEPLRLAVAKTRKVECEKGCALISPEEVDYQFTILDIWKKCINNSIRKVAIEG